MPASGSRTGPIPLFAQAALLNILSTSPRSVQLAFLSLLQVALFGQSMRDSSLYALDTRIDGPVLLVAGAAAFGGAVAMEHSRNH